MYQKGQKRVTDKQNGRSVCRDVPFEAGACISRLWGCGSPMPWPLSKNCCEKRSRWRSTSPSASLQCKKTCTAHPDVSSEAAIPSPEEPEQAGWVGPIVVQEGDKHAVYSERAPKAKGQGEAKPKAEARPKAKAKTKAESEPKSRAERRCQNKSRHKTRGPRNKRRIRRPSWQRFD